MFDNLDDPRKQALLQMGLGLLGNQSGNFGRDLSGAGLLGLSAYNQGTMRQAKLAEEKQQQEMRARAMAAQEAQARAQQEAQARFLQANPQLADRFALDPQGAIKQAFPDPVKPKMMFAPNGQAVDMNSIQPGQSFAKPPEWKDPEYVRTQQAIRAAGRPQISTTTNVMPPREVFKDSLGLKKDFDAQPEVKGFKEVQGAWDQISTALQKPSPANDLAAATKFMKLLDPGSVVRESELMMAMQASGAWDRFTNTADRVLKGHKLTPEQRADFYKSGEALYNASKDRFGQTVQQYEGIAQQYGLDPKFIENAKPRAMPSGPKPGTVDGDYYFKGGNPADPKSWVKRK